MRNLIISTMRNEAPFILEWIAYHLHIGFTDFLIYSNDCDDGTDLLLDRLQELGIVRHERNHSGGKKPVQWRALTKAARTDIVDKADWIYVTDVDEFLNIHVGDGRLTDLIAAAPDAAGFALPWRMFGNNGVDGFVDVPVTTQFTQAAPDALVWPWRAVQFKSLYRNDNSYDKLGVHQPALNGKTQPNWVDGNGNSCPMNGGTVHHLTGTRYGLAQINHYACGSMQGFLVKKARGKPNHISEEFDITYWIERNISEVVDRSIQRHTVPVQAKVDELMTDTVLADLHHRGVAWRQAKIAKLLQTPDGFALYAALRQTPPTVALPMAEQRHLLAQLVAIRRKELAQKSM